MSAVAGSLTAVTSEMTRGEKHECIQNLVGKTKGKRPLWTRHRWEDNIETDLSEIRWDGVDWIHLAEDRDQWRGSL
jgi:hypothetical protein